MEPLFYIAMTVKNWPGLPYYTPWDETREHFKTSVVDISSLIS